MTTPSQPTKEELKACPFCGGRDLHIDSIMIACNFCIVSVPRGTWNTRTKTIDRELLQGVVDGLEEARSCYEAIRGSTDYRPAAQYMSGCINGALTLLKKELEK